jgi:hypothetical protein
MLVGDPSLRRVFALLLLTACAREPSASNTSAPDVKPTAAAVRSEPSSDASACRAAKFPDTPAGRRLEELFAVFNTTDASVAGDFVSTAISPKFTPAQPREQLVRSIQGDGHMVALCRVESSAASEITVILEDTDAQPGNEFGWLIVTVDESGKVTSLGVAPVTREDLMREVEPLDDEGVRHAVDGVADGLAGYVFADKATQMATRIREAMDAGEYAGITDGRKLAWRISNDLFAVTGDKHLGVVYSASVLPPLEPERKLTSEELEDFEQRAAVDNFGMPVAEIREGNVGYLVVLGFLPPELAADAVAETMAKIADADVLVIDLRHNGGGSPHGVALMTSYLFGNKRVHLNDIHYRSLNRTDSFYTSPDVPGRKFGPNKPIYVLTSAATFSAGEEFAYNLQALDRATLVGETTGGGAHPTEFVRVSDHWAIALPTGRAINPVTKTNWEGTGVKPDVEVPAEQALDKALELAAKRGK